MADSIDDLMTRAHAVRTDVDTPATACAELQSAAEETAGLLAQLSQEHSATILSESAIKHVESASTLLQQVQGELDEFIADCEQAKGGGY